MDKVIKEQIFITKDNNQELKEYIDNTEWKLEKNKDDKKVISFYYNNELFLQTNPMVISHILNQIVECYWMGFIQAEIQKNENKE